MKQSKSHITVYKYQLNIANRAILQQIPYFATFRIVDHKQQDLLYFTLASVFLLDLRPLWGPTSRNKEAQRADIKKMNKTPPGITLIKMTAFTNFNWS